MVAGGFYLAIAKAISKIEFEQPAFIAAGGPDILSGKSAGGRPMHGIKNIRHRDLKAPPSAKNGFLQSRIDAPHTAASHGCLQDAGRHVYLAELTGPAAAQLKTMLREDRSVEDIDIDDPTRTKVRLVQLVKAVNAHKCAIPLILEGVGEIQSEDVLGGQVLISHDGFRRVRRIRQGGDEITDMTIAQGGRQFIVIGEGQAAAVGVLRLQQRIALRERIIVYFELKRVEVLVIGPVYTPAKVECPLSCRVLTIGNGSARKKIRIVPRKRRIIGAEPVAGGLVSCRSSFQIGIFPTQADLETPAFHGPFIVDIKRVDVFLIVEVVAV